jgi:3-isopropylmalate dehydratase small subunit
VIFRSNAVKTGLAPIELAEDDLARIRSALEQRNELTVDLETEQISHPGGLSVAFTLDPYARETLLHGLDDIARTLKRDDAIAAYEATVRPRFDTRSLV